MSKRLCILLFLAVGLAWSQTAPDCQFTVSFTSAIAQAPAFSNKPTTSTGPACTSWIVSYWTTGASGVSIQIEGAPDPGTGSPPTSGFTLLTPATSPVTSANPAIGTDQGNILACCDFYPWIRINPTTFTGTSQTMTVRVYGYKGTSQVASGGGGGGAPSGPAGGDLAGSYPNPSVDKVLGGVIPVSAECVGTNGSGQFVATACGAALTYYLQNSSVASGTYTSGGSLSGTGTCNLAITGGGGSGATATVPVTGGAIAGGTPLTITNVGTQFTSAPTAATFGSCTGTATSSGSAVIATVLDGLPSDVSGAYPMLATPYNPVTKAAYAMSTGSGTTNEQTWATAPGQPNLGFIPAGGYICHIHQSRTNAFTGTAVTQCAFQEVDSSGAFIATIGTTDVSGNIGLTEHAETLEYDDPNVYTMASTSSRVAVIVQLVQTSVGASGTLNLYVGGEADAHIILPAVQPPNTIDGVSFCTGFTPTNGQYLQYTTASSPNPCWTAATVTVPTIASTTQTLKGDGSGNASGIGSSSTDCVHPDGSSGACIASSATTVNSQTCALGGSCTVTAAPSGSAGGDLASTYPSPTVANLSNVSNGSLANAGLAHPATTVNGQTCTLGSTCTTGGYLGAPIGNSPTSNAILYGDASGNLQNAAGVTRTALGQLTYNAGALGTTPTDAVILANTTASTSLVQTQFSPSLHWIGQAWNTSTVANQTADVVAYLNTLSGSSLYGLLQFFGQINLGGYHEMLRIGTDGSVNVFGTGATSLVAAGGLIVSTHSVQISSEAANAGQATCFKTNGVIGYCSTVVGATGACTCN